MIHASEFIPGPGVLCEATRNAMGTYSKDTYETRTSGSSSLPVGLASEAALTT